LDEFYARKVETNQVESIDIKALEKELDATIRKYEA
jgi:hypothetical protein